MTTEITPEVATKKRTVLNTLAIIGFFAVVGLVAWLSLWFVQVLPGAFASLARLAESLYSPSSKVAAMTITTSNDTLETGDTVTLGFAAERGEGTYTFAYECLDGVALILFDGQNEQLLRCDVVYSLGTLTEATLKVTSEKMATVSIPYTITFLRTNDTTARAAGTGALTVSNTAIANNQIPVSSETVVEVTITPEAPTTTTPRATPTPTAEPKITPTYQTFSYVPVSVENGYTDLAVSFIEMGEVVGDRLVTRTPFTRNAENFFRFEIKNIGTRTSAPWRFTTTLPGNRTTVRDNQVPLKPNERAIITVRFPLNNTNQSELVYVRVEADRDQTSQNDVLAWAEMVR